MEECLTLLPTSRVIGSLYGGTASGNQITLSLTRKVGPSPIPYFLSPLSCFECEIFPAWFLAGSTILEDCRMFRGWNLPGGSGSLFVDLQVLLLGPTFCSFSASWLGPMWPADFYPCFYSFHAMMDPIPWTMINSSSLNFFLPDVLSEQWKK